MGSFLGGYECVIRAVYPVDQRLEPGDLAEQSRAGCAGARLFRAYIDRLADESDLPLDRGDPGRLCPRTGDARTERPFLRIWVAGLSGAWRGDGSVDLLQLPRRDPGRAGGILYRLDPRCGRHPTGS